MRVLNSVTIDLSVQDLLFWVGIEVGPVPSRLSSSQALDAKDFEQVSPTVIRPRQSSVFSVGEPLECTLC